jgi:hypothetical protein
VNGDSKPQSAFSRKPQRGQRTAASKTRIAAKHLAQIQRIAASQENAGPTPQRFSDLGHGIVELAASLVDVAGEVRRKRLLPDLTAHRRNRVAQASPQARLRRVSDRRRGRRDRVGAPACDLPSRTGLRSPAEPLHGT